MRRVLGGLLLAFSSLSLLAQTGLPRFATIQGSGFDNVNLYNLNVQFQIPIVSITGREFSFSPELTYNSTVYQNTGSTWTASGFGWLRLPAGTVTFSSQKLRCFPDDLTRQWEYRYYNFTYQETNGTVHVFPLDFRLPESPTQYPECSDGNPQSGYATDASGYYVEAPGLGGPSPVNAVHPKAYAPSGAGVDFAGVMYGTNGNYATNTVVNANETDWNDSSGRLALKVITNTTIQPYTTQYQYPDTSGGFSNVVTMTMTAKNVWTSFACANVSEYQQTNVQFPTSVSLPNGRSYTIDYENSTLHSGYTTGRISKITLPTGGYIQYAYGSVNCADGTPLTLTRTVNDGTTSVVWTYTRTQSGVWQTRVTAPRLPYDSASNETLYTFDSNGLETQSKFYQGTVASGTLLRQVDTARTGYLPNQVTTTVGTRQKKVAYGYDAYWRVSSVAEYDWGASTPARTTLYTYNSAQAYLSANILNALTRVEVHDSSSTGTLRSATDYVYDEAGAITSCPTGVPNHNPSYACANTPVRGIATTIKRYADVTVSGGASPVVTTLTYDSFGNALTMTVDGTLQSTATYSATTQYSQPDSVAVGQAGTALTTYFTYFTGNGLLASTTDPNGIATTFLYDNMYRSTSVTRPSVTGTGNVTTTTVYDDTARTATVTSPLDAGRTLTQVSWLDSLGRSYKTQTPAGTTQTSFDPVGQTYQVSNPFSNGGSPSYWTTTKYDGLGRTLSVTTPDSVSSTLSYTSDTTNGDVVTATDGAGKQKKSIYDGLGRLSSVYEPDVANGNSLTVQTSYTYTALDSLLQVTQGVQTRAFSYDGLNRVKTAQTPEAGTVTYSYAGCSKDPSNVCSRTDARGVITNYTYDPLNRLYQASYNVGTSGVPATATVTYTYGTSAASHNNGRLIGLTDGTHIDAYGYDVLGNVSSVGQTLAAQTYTTQYQYNEAGLVTRMTYPSGMYLNQAYANTGQLASLTESSGKQYASGLSYNPAGQLTSYAMGLSGGTVNVALGYSAQRMQLGSLSYTYGANTLFSLSYGYTQNGGNNGQITAINDGMSSGRSATYGYDALARLTSFSTAGSVSYPQKTMSWTYDRYGNRLTEVTNGSTQTVNPSPTTNRLNLTYDANGNLTNDGTYGLTWDAENRMVSYAGGSVTNQYDAIGLRVRRTKQGGSDVIYVFGGTQPIAEYAPGAAPSSPSVQYVYLGNQLVASKAASTYTFYERDHLSIRGVLADASPGSPTEQGDLPFGENWYGSNLKWKFTSYERDSDVGDDFAMFRRFQYVYGRFSSPDPVAGSPENPQSWNRYAYVVGNPVSYTDPLGQFLSVCGVTADCSDEGGGGGYDPGWFTWGCSDVYMDGIYWGTLCNGPPNPGPMPVDLPQPSPPPLISFSSFLCQPGDAAFSLNGNSVLPSPSGGASLKVDTAAALFFSDFASASANRPITFQPNSVISVDLLRDGGYVAGFSPSLKVGGFMGLGPNITSVTFGANGNVTGASAKITVFEAGSLVTKQLNKALVAGGTATPGSTIESIVNTLLDPNPTACVAVNVNARLRKVKE